MKKMMTVALIGAVHIGDVAYYRQLNEYFKQYDALLYELVAPAGTVVPRGRGTSNAHPVGLLQNGIKRLLELEAAHPDWVSPDSPSQRAGSAVPAGRSSNAAPSTRTVPSARSRTAPTSSRGC